MLFGKGASLSWGGAAIAKLKNVGHPEITVESVDVSVHDSLTRFKDYVAGQADTGEVAIDGLFDETDSTGQHALFADAKNGTIREVIITGPNSSYTLTFDAFVTSIKLIGDAPIDNMIPFSASIKPTSEPILAISASTGLTTAFFAISESAVIKPTPAGNVYDYVANVLTGVTSVTLTPTATAGVITVNGSVVTTGQASSAIALGAAGSITTITVVVKETNKVAKTYIIRVVRA